jgi:hypothetical protein
LATEVKLFIGVGILFFVAIIVILVDSNMKKQGKTMDQMYGKAYTFFVNFPLTSESILRIEQRYKTLSIYKLSDIQILAAQTFVIYTSISLGIVVLSFFLYSNAVLILMACVFSMVLKTVLIDKKLDKVNLKVLRALKLAVSAIRQEYLKTNNVTEALESASVPKLMERPINEIHNILTMPKSSLRLEEFFASNPFRNLETLASVCYNINEYGDTINPDKSSSFVNALTMLLTDINKEIERLAKQEQEFKFLEYMALIMVPVIPLLEKVFGAMIPALAVMYNGVVGNLIRLIITAVAIQYYLKIAKINMSEAIKLDDRTVWAVKLLEKPRWKKFIKNIVPKTGNKAIKLRYLINNSLTRNSAEAIYTKKVVYSALAFIVTLIALLISVPIAEDVILNNTAPMSIIPNNDMNEYKIEELLALDKEFLAGAEAIYTNDKAIEALVKSHFPKLSELQNLDQVTRLKDKRDNLSDTYFKWYYIIVCYVIALIAWNSPNKELKERINKIKEASQEDFLQLQTLIATLMYVNLDTMDILKQMYQQSRIYKDVLLYCYHSYPSNPEMELERLKYKVSIPEFKRLIDKLKDSVSNMSIREAFSDLEIERDYILSIRDMAMEYSLKRKKIYCSKLCDRVRNMVIAGEIIFPMLTLGFSSLLESMTAL